MNSNPPSVTANKSSPMKTDLLAAGGFIRGMKLPTPKLNPKPPMNRFTDIEMADIHTAAVAIATCNAILCGFMIGLMSGPAPVAGLHIVCLLGTIFWTLLFLTIALKTRLYLRRSNVTTDAMSDPRILDDDGTTFLSDN